VGRTLEPPEEHLQKLEKWEQSDQFGLADPSNLPLYQAWKQRVVGLVQQRQQLIAAAQAQSGVPQGGEGPGGVPSSGAGPDATAAPQVQPNEFIDEDLQ